MLTAVERIPDQRQRQPEVVATDQAHQRQRGAGPDRGTQPRSLDTGDHPTAHHRRHRDEQSRQHPTDETEQNQPANETGRPVDGGHLGKRGVIVAEHANHPVADEARHQAGNDRERMPSGSHGDREHDAGTRHAEHGCEPTRHCGGQQHAPVGRADPHAPRQTVGQRCRYLQCGSLAPDRRSTEVAQQGASENQRRHPRRNSAMQRSGLADDETGATSSTSSETVIRDTDDDPDCRQQPYDPALLEAHARCAVEKLEEHVRRASRETSAGCREYDDTHRPRQC